MSNMSRSHRQMKILEIINRFEVDTQEDLAEKLRLEGFEVTQATVSRDIKELGLVKVMSENKKYRYAGVRAGDAKFSDKFLMIFKETVLSVDYSLNIIVIKTISGAANSAAALIDKMNLPQIMGCVAGDDTIFIVIRSVDEVKSVIKEFNKLIYS